MIVFLVILLGDCGEKDVVAVRSTRQGAEDEALHQSIVTGNMFNNYAIAEFCVDGENLTTNGIILSADEKTLYVTNGPAIVAFDVQKDGSLTNQREFTKLSYMKQRAVQP
jgi:sugar lactone lactonase YvrE